MSVIGHYWIKEDRPDGNGGRELLLLSQEGETMKTLILWLPVGTSLQRGNPVGVRSFGMSVPLKSSKE